MTIRKSCCIIDNVVSSQSEKCGCDQQTIDLALEYLDITKPRNNELMRKITTRYYPKFRQYNYREKLDKAVKSEISDTGSDELKER